MPTIYTIPVKKEEVGNISYGIDYMEFLIPYNDDILMPCIAPIHFKDIILNKDFIITGKAETMDYEYSSIVEGVRVLKVETCSSNNETNDFLLEGAL